MKKVIVVNDMCCAKCAERIERKLRLLEGVSGAKANFKKGIVHVETTLDDCDLAACIVDAGYTVEEIRLRKGIFE